MSDTEYFNENLLLEDRPLMVLPKLAEAIGLENAIVVQQLFWLMKNPANGKTIDEERWIFNTYQTWQEQYFPFWSERTLRRIFTELEGLKIIQTCQPEGVMSRRKYYRIGNGIVNLLRKGKLSKPVKSRSGQKARIDSHSRPVPITETTIRENSLKETKATSFQGNDASGSFEDNSKPPEYPATWKPIKGTKQEKLRRIKPPEDYPSEAEYNDFVEREDLGSLLNYRGGLYHELCCDKWHKWSEEKQKWLRIKDWKKYVRALDEHIGGAPGH